MTLPAPADTFKVIIRDSFGRDYNGGRSERLFADNLTKDQAEQIARTEQARWGDTPDYFVVVPHAYELYVFEGY